VDIGQRNLDLLIVRYVDASDSRQNPAPVLALALLVPGVLTDHPHDSVAPDDLALVAALLD
jgi:hypothetical protein